MAIRTIASLYDSYDDAVRTVEDLEAAGIAVNDISIVANRGETPAFVTTGEPRHAASGAATGATVGTAVGAGAGLLAGLGILAIPGIGPVVAAGWLVATLAGAGTGATAGGLLGALTGAGVKDDQAHVYAESVRRGGTLVTVRADEMQVGMVDEIMRRHNPVDADARGSAFRGAGWNAFQHDAGPYAASEAEQQRIRDLQNPRI
jgi:hypothetical protein